MTTIAVQQKDENSDETLSSRATRINPELFFQLDDGDRRGHDQKLFKQRFRLNVRKYAFSNRVIGICCLPVALIVVLFLKGHSGAD